jgi:thioesterase domain-containing protein
MKWSFSRSMLESAELLNQLLEHGILLFVDGDRLRLNAPKGVLTPALQAEITNHKLELIMLLKQSTARAAYPQIRPGANKESLPLSVSQEHLWTLTQLAPDSPLYNMYLAFRIYGSLDKAVLEKSLIHIVERHEPLRTRFSLLNGQPIQHVVPSIKWSLSLIDLSKSAASEFEVSRKIAEEVNYAFDPLNDLLFRVHLLKLNDTEHVLTLVMHHLISDGLSWAIFLNDLTTLYGSNLKGEIRDLPDLPVQYGDFVVWQREFVASSTHSNQRKYWESVLEGVPALDLPLDFARQSSMELSGARAELSLTSDLSARIRDFSKIEGATIFMTLFAAFQALLNRVTAQEDLLICTPVSGRTLPETEIIIGYFNNLLPLRVAISGDLTFRDLLGRVRQNALAAFEYPDVPLHQIAHTPSLMNLPFSRAMFSLQDNTGHTLTLEDLQVEPIPAYNQTANFELCLTVQDQGRHLNLVAEYRTALFQPETIQNLLTDYRDVLLAGIANPGVLLADLLPNPRIGMRDLATVAPERRYAPPTTPLEYQLIHIWEDTFNMQPIGVQDNFFHLGGHSLLALRLFSRIQQEMNVNLPLATLFKDPTIRYLAELIERGQEHITWNSLVPIKAAGSRLPFFGVHGMDGNVLFWHNITLHLPPDLPFYGLQAQGVDGRSKAIDSIPDMASCYLQEVRRVQPQGPYHLGGYSLGGEIAFEMAHQLIRQGETVALVVMFDTSNPNRAVRPSAAAGIPNSNTSRGLGGRLGVWRRKIGGHFSRLSKLSLGEQIAYFGKEATMRFGRLRLKWTVNTLHRLGRILPDDVLLQYLRESHIKALMNYIPEVYPGQITMFRARESLKDNPIDSPMGWKPLAEKGLKLVVFEGNHADVYNPEYAGQLAEMLTECLNDLE